MYLLTLRGGELWEPTETDLANFYHAYPKVDIASEFKKMECWLYVNKEKRKTKQNIKKFVNNWLKGAKVQPNSSSPMPISPLDPFNLAAKSISMKEMTREMHETDITWVPLEMYLSMKNYYLYNRGMYFDGELKNAG